MESKTDNKTKVISIRFSQAEYEAIKLSAQKYFDVKDQNEDDKKEADKNDEKAPRIISKYIRMKVLSDTNFQVKTEPIYVYKTALFRECKTIPRSLNDLAKQANHMARSANSDNAERMLAIISKALNRIYDHIKQYEKDATIISTPKK